MKPFIEKIFSVHDSQIYKKNKFSKLLGLISGIIIIISSPIIIFYGNSLAEQIIEKRTNIHMYFIDKTDSNVNVASNERKEKCMSDELLRTTKIDNELTERIPYILALLSFLIGYNLIQISLLSFKLIKKFEIEEKT